jgi:hypothetical protein
MEMMRKDWPEFMQFAQSYVTACYPGVYKAWHFHKKQWDHFICLWGMAKVVLCATISPTPPASLATTGTPASMASIMVRGSRQGIPRTGSEGARPR